MRDQRARLLRGDCIELMAQVPAASVDAIITDPPYDLTAVSRGGSPRQFVDNPYGRTRLGTDRGGFMGKTWDSTGVAFKVDTWRAAFRVLKPGAHLLAFGGTRTYHRMACAIEDAGFEIRDSVVWLYGSGFPKSTRVRGAGWEGWGTALKPGHETIVVARKPLSERSVEANVQEHGTGAINIDGCRIAHLNADDLADSEGKNQHTRYANPASNRDSYSGSMPPRTDYDGSRGRWPANVVLSHSPGCRLLGTRKVRAITGTRSGSWRHGHQYSGGWQGARPDELGQRIGLGSDDGTETVEAWECLPGCPVAELDQQSGRSRSRRGEPRAAGESGTAFRLTHSGEEYDDVGGASRFFYVAKPSTRERNTGLAARANDHPTVKPVMLLRHLCRLITPPGGLILDPFAGSGSTGVAAVSEGFRFLGMELDGHYLGLATRRIRNAVAEQRQGGRELPEDQVA